MRNVTSGELVGMMAKTFWGQNGIQIKEHTSFGQIDIDNKKGGIFHNVHTKKDEVTSSAQAQKKSFTIYTVS